LVLQAVLETAGWPRNPAFAASEVAHLRQLSRRLFGVCPDRSRQSSTIFADDQSLTGTEPHNGFYLGTFARCRRRRHPDGVNARTCDGQNLSPRFAAPADNVLRRQKKTDAVLVRSFIEVQWLGCRL
jgi:hypothetical protein